MFKFIGRLLLWLLIFALLIGGLLAFLGYREYKAMLDENSLSLTVARVRDKEHYTLFDQLPETYVKAVVAVEDRRFYQHGGVDIIGIGRAVYVNLRDKELHEGGSTITQQLAKNLYSINNRDIVKKIAEAFLAIEIEKNYTKDEILELYANSIYFGDGYYCIYDAAEGYFGVEPRDMDEYQCTMLAGVPNAPSAYSPTKNPELAEERRQIVLRRMKENE